MEICESSGKEGGGYQNQASANNWGGAEGSKIWSFCDNVIIEWHSGIFPEKICCNFRYKNLY